MPELFDLFESRILKIYNLRINLGKNQEICLNMFRMEHLALFSLLQERMKKDKQRLIT